MGDKNKISMVSSKAYTDNDTKLYQSFHLKNCKQFEYHHTMYMWLQSWITKIYVKKIIQL